MRLSIKACCSVTVSLNEAQMPSLGPSSALKIALVDAEKQRYAVLDGTCIHALGFQTYLPALGVQKLLNT